MTDIDTELKEAAERIEAEGRGKQLFSVALERRLRTCVVARSAEEAFEVAAKHADDDMSIGDWQVVEMHKMNDAEGFRDCLPWGDYYADSVETWLERIKKEKQHG